MTLKMLCIKFRIDTKQKVEKQQYSVNIVNVSN